MATWTEWPIDETTHAEAEGGRERRAGHETEDGYEIVDPRAETDDWEPGEREWDALSQFMAALQDLPALSADEVTTISMEIGERETEFRAAICSIPSTSERVLGRWEEKRAAGRVTGVLCHRHRDEPDADWSAFIDERMTLLSKLAARRARSVAAGKDASQVEGQMARALSSAHIQLDVLQEICLELRELIGEPSTLAIARRRSELGVDSAGTREGLARAEKAIELRNRARKKLGSHNLRLVVFIAKRYRNLGVPFLDLIQEGSIGLYRAVDKFDPSLGYKFSTYAVWWIQQSVIRAIQKDSRTVRVPSSIYDAQLKYKRAQQKLSHLVGEPDRAGLAGELGVSEEQVELVASTLLKIGSLDTPFDDADEGTMAQRLPDPTPTEPVQGLDHERLRSVISDGLSDLKERERDVLRYRFGLETGEELTLQQIGDRLGLSRERVRQIQNGALSKLRDQSDVLELREML